MNSFFKSPVAQFAVFVIAVVAYSVITGISLETIFEQELDQLTAAPTATPLVLPTANVKGLQTATESAQVVSEVIDGDTIRLSSGETVRYIGVDTPETKHPQISKECFGEEASLFNEQLVLGKTVLLEKDVSETDRYGRLLRYVWLDGEMVNQTLVTQGYAEASSYPPDVKYQSLLEEAEQQARENARGLWGLCDFK